MATRRVTLELNEEQEECIKALFRHNEWDYIEKTSKKAVKKKQQVIQPSPELSAQVTTVDSGPSNHSDPNGDNDNNPKCPECFMYPCVTVSQAHLGGTGQEASECNASIRKCKYRTFWSVINNLGGWNIEHYIEKKRREADSAHIVFCKREIMPLCVLKFVRGLYPNPPNISYCK